MKKIIFFLGTALFLAGCCGKYCGGCDCNRNCHCGADGFCLGKNITKNRFHS